MEEKERCIHKAFVAALLSHDKKCTKSQAWAFDRLSTRVPNFCTFCNCFLDKHIDFFESPQFGNPTYVHLLPVCLCVHNHLHILAFIASSLYYHYDRAGCKNDNVKKRDISNIFFLPFPACCSPTVSWSSFYQHSSENGLYFALESIFSFPFIAIILFSSDAYL